MNKRLGDPSVKKWTAEDWLPPRDSYVLCFNDLWTVAAKIPPYVPHNFGGSNGTFWYQIGLSATLAIVLNSAESDHYYPRATPRLPL